MKIEMICNILFAGRSRTFLLRPSIRTSKCTTSNFFGSVPNSRRSLSTSKLVRMPNQSIKFWAISTGGVVFDRNCFEQNSRKQKICSCLNFSAISLVKIRTDIFVNLSEPLSVHTYKSCSFSTMSALFRPKHYT